MGPTYYLLKNKYILRMESVQKIIPALIYNYLLDQVSPMPMNQAEANQRLVMYRDAIIEYDEFLERYYEQL